MKYYIVKTQYGYYDKMLGSVRVSYSSAINFAHKFTSRKSAEKRANALGGKVLEFTLDEWLSEVTINK